MTRKILYITGTRADYGLMRSVLRRIHEQPDLSLDIVVTGMHLMEEYGHTVDEIQSDGYSYHTVDVRYEGDTQVAMAIFIGRFIEKLTLVVSAIKPDIILLLGDRGEMLAGAIVGTYLSIPVAHISGGDITLTVDEHIRHAITKLAQIHFPYTEKSAKRIIMMGERPECVHTTGAPGLDDIIDTKFVDRISIAKKYNLDLTKPVALLIQHPVTLEFEDALTQIENTLQVLVEMSIPTIIIYPNADKGGRAMIQKIKEFEHINNIQVYKSIQRDDFLKLLKVISVMIGNSSSGIVEAASFKLPVINIGTRQSGRECGQNVLNAMYDKNDIRAKIEYALYNPIFQNSLSKITNPYGDGCSGERIVEVLSKLYISNDLIQKQLNYNV